MNVGPMRHRVTVSVPSRTDDGAGGFTRSDDTSLVVSASITPLSDREIMQASQLQQRITHKIVVRHNPVIVQGVSLVLGSRTFYVRSVTNPDERQRYMKIMAEEGQPS